MESLKLSPRLKVIASFVELGDVVIDVGTDHGYLPVWLIKNNICHRAIATDINEKPLSKAVDSAEKYNVSEKIKFVHTDGLSAVDDNAGNTITVAGMGGETIISILQNVAWIKDPSIKLILQPMTKTEELYMWLDKNDFHIDNEKLVMDEHKIYTVMLARYNPRGNNSANSILGIGRMLIMNNDELLESYINILLKKKKKALYGIRKSENPANDVLKQLENDVNRLIKLKEDILSDNRERYL